MANGLTGRRKCEGVAAAAPGRRRACWLVRLVPGVLPQTFLRGDGNAALSFNSEQVRTQELSARAGSRVLRDALIKVALLACCGRIDGRLAKRFTSFCRDADQAIANSERARELATEWSTTPSVLLSFLGHYFDRGDCGLRLKRA